MENFKERSRQYLKTLNAYKLYIIIGVAVITAIVVPLILYKQNQYRDANEVWSRMWRINNDAQLVEQEMDPEKTEGALKAAISEYTFLKDNLSTTSSTPWLLLELGNTQYKAEKYDEAITTYKGFMNRYGNHPLLFIVRQSLGYSFEEKGQLQEAIDQFEMIAKDPEATFAKSQAKLDAGRCYEKLGQSNLATAAYKEVINISPESHWAKLAKYQLEASE